MRKKISVYLLLILFFLYIFSPLSVHASVFSDQSKPIFGLTADQVVEKYNQLTDQQKDQVLRSLGNASIFANSLFGNIFNSSFGVLNDAIEKIGDLFFQVNGVIYKLGSSALSWVSRLIDRVFNDDLNDLNISQPVINDLYLNTRGLTYTSLPFFTNGVCPSSFPSNIFNSNLSGYPLDCEYIFNFHGTISYSSRNTLYGIKKSRYSSNNWYRLIVDVDNHTIYFGHYSMSVLSDGSLVPDRYSTWGTPFHETGYGNDYYYLIHYDFSYDYSLFGNGSWSSSISTADYISPPLSFSGNDYLPYLQQYLNTYFSWADSYLLVQNNQGFILPIQHDSESINVTNNTYYNFIYNIPDQTPLNVVNIVSNSSINYYDPIENIGYYLPGGYNIEQNFSVVNNYYISSGSAISGQAIDVNLVSPSVIDVRIINPEDISSEIDNNIKNDILNNYDIDFGDLNINAGLSLALNNANDSFTSVKDNPAFVFIGGFLQCIPSELYALFVGLASLILIISVYNLVTHKGGSG